jgi:RNA polymerase sigma factor (sigma-70 family)
MSMLTQAEETSLIALVSDDYSAFEKLYNYYFPRIYNYVHYRVSNFHAADDIISQTFEKLFSRFRYYQSEKATFSVWLFTIARNTIIDYYRSESRTQLTSIETAAELASSESNPEETAIFNEIQQKILKALAVLSKREQDIIALKFWSGFSNREIAKLLNISESNTGIILFRAMRRLRIILESQGLSVND